MSPCSIVSLTTDFGLSDWFVGTMRGVVLGINPGAIVVDINHEIPAGDIRAGAFVLAASYRFFPKGTVHVAIIDPGVGSQRRSIAAQTTNHFFVGPDNGVLSWALRNEKIDAVHALENRKYFLPAVSQTFHGRDVFAPVAAHLSRGIEIGQLGPRVNDLERMPWPQPRRSSNRVDGEVVYLDHFGNAITNIEAQNIDAFGKRRLSVWLGGKRVCSLGRYYQSVAKGTPVALIGSTGFLEVAVNGGSATNSFGIRVGDCVQVIPHNNPLGSTATPVNRAG
jgi:S-adenosylmethionine hydrolase